MKVEYLRSGVLTVDGESYEIIFNADGGFEEVCNKKRQCVADPAGLMTVWDWKEGKRVKHTRLSKQEWENQYI